LARFKKKKGCPFLYSLSFLPDEREITGKPYRGKSILIYMEKYNFLTQARFDP